MANESSFASLLDDSFAMDDVDGNVTKLKDAIENLNLNFEPETLQRILQECLSSCTSKSLDEKIFSEILPIAHRFVLEILTSIDEKLNANGEMNVLDDVKKQLFTCHELLDIWEKCAEHLSNLRNIPASDVKCVSENLPTTVKLIFEHCKRSPKLYGALFEGVTNELTKLFRKAKTILKLFLATLEGVIVFDTDAESETELLVKVINTVGCIVTIANELDLKTFVEATKTFGKLAVIYHHDVKRVSAESVTVHLEQMTKDISVMLAAIKDSPDEIEERKIKVLGHLLKILDKLFAAYCSCLNNESLYSVIDLLLQMHRCSPPCLRILNIDEKIIDSINVLISLGSEPFLNTVFKNADFKQAYFEYEFQENIDKLGYHLLTISIMKKLVAMPYEQRQKWILGADSILDVALTNINNIQEEICVGEIRLPGARDIGERVRYATLYEATLVPICSLISQIPPDGFYIIELLLLKHLLSGRFWSSLMTTDIWCFISRLGSSDLCVSHVKYLLKVHAALANRSDSLEVVILENLIGRLYSLLSDEMKHSVVIDLDDSVNHLWIPIARFFTPKTKSFLGNRLTRTLNEIPDVFAELQRQPSVENWNRLRMHLSILGKLGHLGDKRIVDRLLQIWNAIASTIEDFEGKQLDILFDFVMVLLNATRPENIQDDTFCTILEAVLKSSFCFPPHAKVVALHYLRDNANAFGICGQRTANVLAELNCQLLEDENAWVRQEALESFDYVAHVCPNEDLVTRMASAVSRKSSIRDFLPAYLSCELYFQLNDFPDVRTYMHHLVQRSQDISHICSSYEESQRNDKVARMETQMSEDTEVDPSSNDFDQRVDRICKELDDILKMKRDITDYALKKLRVVCTKILSSTELLQ